jgi:hypothetical protein
LNKVDILTVDILTVNILTFDILTFDILTVDILTVDILTVDILTVDILTVDILTVDILTVNTFGSRHCNNVAPIGSTDTEAARQGDQIGLIFSIDNSLKITELARNLGLCFSTVNVTRHTLQKCVGLQDGQLFYKLIWGRCYDHNFLRF